MPSISITHSVTIKSKKECKKLLKAINSSKKNQNNKEEPKINVTVIKGENIKNFF